METFLGLMIGIGLSAATGFRVFVPLLGMGIASLSGHLTLSPGFEWIGSWPAVIAFATATVLETGVYYVPWLDNFMDSIATPAAVIAGTVMTASMVGDMSPFLKWSLALIAGGGTAGIIQAGTVMLRGASTATTAGFGNFAVATAEIGGSVFLTFLALALPVVCAVAVISLVFFSVRRLISVRHKRAVQVP